MPACYPISPAAVRARRRPLHPSSRISSRPASWLRSPPLGLFQNRKNAKSTSNAPRSAPKPLVDARDMHGSGYDSRCPRNQRRGAPLPPSGHFPARHWAEKYAHRCQLRRGPRLKFSLMHATVAEGEGAARRAASPPLLRRSHSTSTSSSSFPNLNVSRFTHLKHVLAISSITMFSLSTSRRCIGAPRATTCTDASPLFAPTLSVFIALHRQALSLPLYTLKTS
ncbi:hypothetical protein FB107DRAFT_246809 [Schizophyllum commune]